MTQVFFEIRTRIYGWAILTLTLLSAACNPERKPNILLIVGEDHSPHLSCYGDTVIQTPNIDALAKDGLLFTNAYVTQSTCSPSRSSILSGLYPHQSGHLGLATHGYHYVIPVENLYQILKTQGYRTGMIGKLHVNPPEDFPIDFHPIKDSNFDKKGLERYARYAEEFINASDDPFFLMMNYPDSHWPFQDVVEGRPRKTVGPEDVGVFPYIAWDNAGIRETIARLYNCILRLDECVGELLDVLQQSGKSDNTLVIYLSDHGDQLARGKYDIYEASTKIPLIVKWPKKTKKGAKSDALISTVDLFPTIAEVSGYKITDATLTGKSLTPLFQNPDSPFRELLFTERNSDYKGSHYPRRAVRDQRFKLIETLLIDRDNPLATLYLTDTVNAIAKGGPKEWEIAESPVFKLYNEWRRPPRIQLYDLQKDPYELTDLSDVPAYTTVKNNLLAKLKTWQKETDDPLRFPEKLKELTYEHDTIKTSRAKSDWLYPKYLYQ